MEKEAFLMDRAKPLYRARRSACGRTALHVSPASFFHFDKEERNEKVLRKTIEVLLEKSDPEQVHRLLKTLLEP